MTNPFRTPPSGHAYRRTRRGRGAPVRAVAAGAAVLAGMSLAACSSSSGSSGSTDGAVTLKVALWDAAEATSKTQSVIDEFQKANPTIKVEVQAIPFSDYEQKLLQQLRAGQTPDVIQTFGNFTADFAAAGALAPLDEYADSTYQGQMLKQLLQAGVIDNKLVAVPWAVQPVGLWYNKKLMTQAGLDPNKPPATVNDLVSALAAVKAKVPGVIPMGIDSTNRVFGLDVNYPWIRAFGANPIDGTTAGADSAGMKSYLDFMRTLGTKGYTEINQKIGYFRPLAAQDKVAFIEDQSILEAVIKATNTKITNDEFNATWGVATMPAGADGKSYSVPQDHQLAMMKASSNKKAAWTFIQWMTRSEAGDLHVLKNKAAFPAATTLPPAAQTLLDADKALKFFRSDITPTIVTPPWGAHYAAASAPIMIGVQQAMTSGKSIGAIASEMQGSLKSALQ